MCTCDQLLHKLSNLTGLLSWSFMLPPPNRFPSALQPFPLAFVVKLLLNNTFLQTHAPFRSFTFLLDVGIELTANQCQSVWVCCFPFSSRLCLAESRQEMSIFNLGHGPSTRKVAAKMKARQTAQFSGRTGAPNTNIPPCLLRSVTGWESKVRSLGRSCY